MNFIVIKMRLYVGRNPGIPVLVEALHPRHTLVKLGLVCSAEMCSNRIKLLVFSFLHVRM